MPSITRVVCCLPMLLLACRAQSAARTSDSRTALVLPTEAVDAIRIEMRTLLGSLHTILAAPPHDTAAIRQAAQAAGMSAAADTALERLVPEAFLEMGMATHREFDSLAVDVGKGISRDSVVALLGLITTNCVSCHMAFRLAPAGPQ